MTILKGLAVAEDLLLSKVELEDEDDVMLGNFSSILVTVLLSVDCLLELVDNVLIDSCTRLSTVVGTMVTDLLMEERRRFSAFSSGICLFEDNNFLSAWASLTASPRLFCL